MAELGFKISSFGSLAGLLTHWPIRNSFTFLRAIGLFGMDLPCGDKLAYEDNAPV